MTKSPIQSPRGPEHAPRAFFALFLLNGTVFVSSFCMMVIELTAGRIIAKSLGASLYTWTSVIGVVLAGIAAGNYAGGLIADRRGTKRTLAILFVFSSTMSASIVVLDSWVGGWSGLWMLSWPARVASHVALVFFLPAAMLGTISPVVAKMALEVGKETGRTLGSVYAWATVGSIGGTFATGFWLVDLFGTRAIIWAVAGVLALMGLYYGLRSASTWGWAGVLLVATVLGTARWSWASQAGEKLGLRDLADPTLLYSDESQYSTIRVFRSGDEGDIRQFMLDTLMHSEIDMHSPFNFQYSYEKVYAGVTKRLFKGRDRVDNLTIGGGGYVYPRYMEATWPAGRTEVAEIDPAVTEAAKAAFGLPRDTKIKCHDEDGRVLIDRLAQRHKLGEKVEAFDVIYCDAVNDYSVPYQLTTVEFMRMADSLIKPGGAYIVNMIDVYDTGLLLSAMYNTMREVFPHVYVLMEGVPLDEIHEDRNTFVLVGVRNELDINELGAEYEKECKVYPLTSEQLVELSNKTRGLVLRDDFCPVENLLAPVVLRSTTERAYEDWCRRGRKFLQQREFAEAADCFRSAVEAYPSRRSVAALNDLGRALTEQGRIREANETYLRAIHMDASFALTHLNLAENLLSAGKRDEAVASMLKGLAAGSGSMGIVFTAASLFQRAGELSRAAICYEEVVKLNANNSDARNNLATVLAAQGKLAEAAEHLSRGIRRDPHNADMLFNLGQILLRMGRTDEAIAAYRGVLKIDPRHLDARSGLATALATQNQLDPAITELVEVVRIAPNMPDAHFNLAAMLEQKGEFDEALHHYQEVLRIDPSDAAAAQAAARLRDKRGKP